MWDKQQQHDGTVVINIYSPWYYGKWPPVTWWWRISSAGDIRTRKAVDNVEFL